MQSSHKKNICKAIKDRGGEYFFVVKNNQKTRKEDIECYFKSKECTHFVINNTGHDRVETRRLWILKTPWHLYHWHGCKHLCKIERIRHNKSKNKESREISYAITSLDGEEVNPEKIMNLWRDHWKIENQLHWIKDTEFNEDKSIVRKANSPQFFSCIRNKTLEILSKMQGRIKHERETLARFPKRSLRILAEN